MLNVYIVWGIMMFSMMNDRLHCRFNCSVKLLTHSLLNIRHFWAHITPTYHKFRFFCQTRVITTFLTTTRLATNGVKKLFGRKIIFEVFQPKRLRYVNVTDGRIDRQTNRWTDDVLSHSRALYVYSRSKSFHFKSKRILCAMLYHSSVTALYSLLWRDSDT